MTKLYADGLGEPLGGDILASVRPLLSSGPSMWFVNSAGGVNGSQRESNRNAPFATLEYAISKAGTGDVIVLEAGHTETLSGPVTLLEGMTVIGIGSAAGVPMATLTMAGTEAGIFCPNNAWQIRNVRFAKTTTGYPHGIIQSSSSFWSVVGCRFEVGEHDTTGGLVVNEPGNTLVCRIENTTFLANGTAAAPAPGLLLTAVATSLELYGCTFDGGQYGWSGYAADASVDRKSVV